MNSISQSSTNPTSFKLSQADFGMLNKLMETDDETVRLDSNKVFSDSTISDKPICTQSDQINQEVYFYELF